MTNTMTEERLKECLAVVETALDDMKATAVVNQADSVGAEAKQAGFMPLGREGGTDSDWTLIDLGSVVVHMMTPAAREFYDLEGLWSSPDQLAELVAVPREKKTAGRRNKNK